MSETAKQFLSRIGAIGGKKSRRVLSKKDARKMAEARWGKSKETK